MCKKINEQRERDRERGRKAERDNLYKCKEKCVWHRNRKLTTKITQYRLKCSNKKKRKTSPTDDYYDWVFHINAQIYTFLFTSVPFGSARLDLVVVVVFCC